MRAFQLVIGLVAVAAAGKTASKSDYDDKIKQWRDSTTKESFISQFNKEHKGYAVKGARAERLWVHINDMLDNHAVRFPEGHTTEFSYTLPISHHLTFLPDFVCEFIELLSRVGRKFYYKTLYAIHDEGVQLHHDLFEYIHEVGAAHVMIILCSGYLVIAFLSWLINRFTDGVTPTQRKLNQETRRRAEEYLRSKRDN